MPFLIVVCAKCGRYVLAKTENQTRTCPYCGFTVIVNKAKKVASAKTANEASAILRSLKQETAQKRNTANPKI